MIRTTKVQGPAIRFADVGLRLGNTQILHDITFTVGPGQLHCIIGPNGGGKTSLVRSLLGQMPHTGEIRIEWPAGQRIGYVPQILDFDRDLPMTVDDFMAIISQDRMAIFGIARKNRPAIDEALEMVGLRDKRKRRMGELSGGERQRVLFAQALIPFPDLLVLDEPLAGVDGAGAEIISDLVIELRDRGVTVMWIHHDLAEVKRIAD
ncbi:MAG TPA: metal ABC transporter ATP-binding protein, partial [Ktedonobacterales bacterium]|nr:metal ABC transporter ATP-binding protein [Ktedonobacterales bacterium]